MKQRELDKILKNPKVKFCYISKGSFYGPNHCGYTERICKAGVYTKEDAVASAMRCTDLYVQPIDISEHNDMIMKEVKELLTRFIPI